MGYMFRCPLCLKRLDADHTLVAFRITETAGDAPPPSVEVDCDDEDFMEEIITWGGDALYTPATDKSVFISHIQCDAVNPFWTEEVILDADGDEAERDARIKIPPGDGGKITWSFRCELTGNTLKKEMQHKVISMLRLTKRYNDLHRPMWFPFGLLRSTAALGDEDLRRPFGSLVEMASAPGVGKTILTLQLMNEQTYANRDGRFIDSAAYFFPRREGVADQAQSESTFMDELFFHASWAKRPEFRPLPTTAITPGDLRAVFIKPVGGLTKLALQPHRTSSQNGSRRQKVWEAIAYFLQSVGFMSKSQPPQTDVLKELSHPRYWHPILFYDTAGETQLRGSEITMAVRNLTNKLAICIDAQEVFDSNSDNSSINLACERIHTMIQEEDRKSCCLVITKLDTLPLIAEERATLMRIAEDLETPDDEARRLLVEWLEKNRDRDKDNLRRYLLSSDSRVERVFFVWTEGLPKMRGIRSYPLDSFEPERGDVGTGVTIKATNGYDFKRATKLYFNGREAQFQAESSGVIKTKVPEHATTGFIEIEFGTGANKDEGTSEKYFVVNSSPARPDELPQSYGLIKFLAWCIDKSPATLTEVLGTSAARGADGRAAE